MATTTNYGWTTPDDTALVKDGASAIRALGTAIDTSMNTALGTKKSGLVLLNTTSFSAVSSQSVNDVFSATYDNYKIIWNIEHSVGLVALLTRLRVSGADATGANYNYQQLNADNTISGSRSQNATFSELGLVSVDAGNDGSADIGRPFLAKPTSWIAQSKTRYNSPYGRNHWAEHTLSTSYTGYTIYVSSGSITGTISTYGYNK